MSSLQREGGGGGTQIWKVSITFVSFWFQPFLVSAAMHGTLGSLTEFSVRSMDGPLSIAGDSSLLDPLFREGGGWEEGGLFVCTHTPC
mmetsp:Transcript_137272/g.238730  ORF Transcript_137272/g.238730 Transcript_137272/m.238730 type:complete len:88 (+) Transcript_137272:515-778(+)